MKQRVAIARGMAMEPDILLMDEPFAALDALTRRKMQDELLQLWDDTHFTVLFVTHSIPEAIKIGSRILLLSPHPGQVKAELNSLPRDARRRDPEAHSAGAQDPRDAVRRRGRGRGGAPMSEFRRATHVRRFYREPVEPQHFGVVEKPLSAWERIVQHTARCARSRSSSCWR